MEKHKVLIVEDDPYLGLMMKECFEDRDFEAHHFKNGKEGFKAYNELKPDVCIFDVMMPIQDGFSLAKEIREIDRSTPIIFTTAKSMKEDVLEGFNAGADDYVKKPFSMEELIARVKAVIRRSGNEVEEKVQNNYQIGKYTFDCQRQTLSIKDKIINLTGKEAELLILFCNNFNQIVDRNIALKKIWGDDSFFNARSMDVFITKLRKYLKHDPDIELVNIRGKGYKLLVMS